MGTNEGIETEEGGWLSEIIPLVLKKNAGVYGRRYESFIPSGWKDLKKKKILSFLVEIEWGGGGGWGEVFIVWLSFFIFFFFSIKQNTLLRDSKLVE